MFPKPRYLRKEIAFEDAIEASLLSSGDWLGGDKNDYDRELMVDKADGVATAIVNGIQRFLDDVPRSKIFGEDLIVPQQRGFPSPSPRT